MLTLAACTKTIDVPPDRFEAASRDTSDPHLIRVRDGGEFIAERFAITESTLTIGKLSPADKKPDATVPITFPIRDIVSIQRIDHGAPVWVWLLGGALLVGAIAALSGGDAFTD